MITKRTTVIGLKCYLTLFNSALAGFIYSLIRSILSIINILLAKKQLYLFVLIMLYGCVTEPAGSTANAKDYEERNVELAYGYFVHGYHEKAIARLQKVLAQNNNSVLARNLLALIYLKQGEFQLSESQFRNALKIDPSASDVRNNYGVLLTEEGRFDEAYTQFFKATKDVYYKNRSEAFYNLGRVCLKLEKEKQAEAFLLKAVRLNPKLAKAHLQLSIFLLEQGTLPEAAAHFEKYQELTEDLTFDNLKLAVRIYNKLGKLEEIKHYQRLLETLYPSLK